MEVVPVFKPLLESEEIAAACRSLEVGWLGMGADVADFEDALTKLIGLEGRRLAAVSTGHAALHIALLLCGVGPGDEVITASFNNVADLQAIVATGAQPVFCDVSPSTLCIDALKIESLIGPRTRALIAMDYACHVCDHAVIGAIAQRHRLRVVHDAAHSIGSRYQNRVIGSFSDLTIFSFDPVKTITTIDGGAIVVNDDSELGEVREIRLMGMGQPTDVMYQNRRVWTYDVKRVGFRYHLANLHAAIGVAQVGKFERIAATRRESFYYYSKHLSDLMGLMLPCCDLANAVPFLFYVRVDGGRRKALSEHLRSRGIDSGIHWRPGHSFSLFRNCRRGDLTVTDQIGQEVLTLPFHSAMERSSQDRVIDALRSFAW